MEYLTPVGWLVGGNRRQRKEPRFDNFSTWLFNAERKSKCSKSSKKSAEKEEKERERETEARFSNPLE